MKKTLLLSIAILLVFAASAFAAPPQIEWEKKPEEPAIITRGTDVLVSLTPGTVSNVVIRKHKDPDSAYSTAIHNYSITNGLFLSGDIKSIAGRNTTAKGACIGQNGDIITTGSCDNGTNLVFWTAGYRPDPHGWLWDIIDESEQTEQAHKVVTDEYGSIYVIGYTWTVETGADIIVHKYDSDRNHVWKTTIVEEGDDYAYGMDAFKVVSTKRLYLALERRKAADDCHTFIYDLSSETGTLDPARTFKFGARINFLEVHPTGARFGKKSSYLAADDCFYISGTLDYGEDKDFWVACCDYEGNYLWERTFDGGHNDWANAIASGFGYVYVAGTSNNGTDNDCRVIRYDEAGNESWNITYGAEGDQGLSTICLDPAGNFYVTGYTGDVEADSLQELVIKYSQPDVTGIEEQPSPSSVTLEVSYNLTDKPIIYYFLPTGQSSILTFYSADGRKLESYTLDAAQSAFRWITDRPAGVYFARLVAGNLSTGIKIILTK
ncbi:hypothetical protein JXM67_09145 [candidate division WOR-3 bacterium]|nr:hypothetical protein [candidate division WOR-3 bacterium]